MLPPLRVVAVTIMLVVTAGACSSAVERHGSDPSATPTVDGPSSSSTTPSSASPTPTSRASTSSSSTTAQEIRDAPCLVTSKQLTEAIGVPQEIREPRPGVGAPGTLACETVPDERSVYMGWSTLLPYAPTSDELRDFVSRYGMAPVEVDLGGGLTGWAGAGRIVGRGYAEVVTVLDGQILTASTMAMEDVAPGPARLRDDAVALARALVAGSQD